MNFVFFSPHFPPNYRQFAIQMNYLGANVLGLADEPYDLLHPELRAVLKEYYRVNDMHNYDELLRACGFLTHRFGKIDRIDSFNEYWLELEARLRTDFNVFGLKTRNMPRIKRKSAMKEVYRQAGVPAARGKVVNTQADSRELVAEAGYPLVAKPDIGVGAAKTYKIHNDVELEQFFAQKPEVDYFLEEYVDGVICTFDGLTDHSGTPVFYTSHQYSQGVMETVNNDDDIYYYSLRDIPDDLEDAGLRLIKAFDVKERFFHFEFFRRHADGKIMGLEVNMRPPGGFTTDMFNYANDIDIYKEWAYVVVHNKFTAEYSRPYHCAYAGRKFHRQYAYDHHQLISALGDCLVHHEALSGVFSRALGDYGYIIRSPSLDEIQAMVSLIQAPA